jgi:hypothetical protein
VVTTRQDRAAALAAVLASKLTVEEYAELRFFLSDYTLDTWLCQALVAADRSRIGLKTR